MSFVMGPVFDMSCSLVLACQLLFLFLVASLPITE